VARRARQCTLTADAELGVTVIDQLAKLMGIRAAESFFLATPSPSPSAAVRSAGTGQPLWIRRPP
jgi:hypothetical protein